MPELLKAILIDDEQESLDNLEYYLLKYCPNINICFKVKSIVELLSILKNNKVDIAFMDIEVYDDNIFSVLSNLPTPHFKIVFVTAYESYALKAFKVDALDYILKPISKNDILNCYLKIQRFFTESDSQPTEAEENPVVDIDNKIILKQLDKIYVLRASEIIFLEANGYYTVVHFNYMGENKTVTISKPISHVEAEYDNKSFFRVHKSFTINIKKIKEIIKKDSIHVLMEDDCMVPVSKRKVNEFLSFVAPNNA